MKKNLATILALVLVVAMLVPAAAFAASNDKYTVSLKVDDGTNSYTVSAENITGSDTLASAVGAEVAKEETRAALKEKFAGSALGALFDELVVLAKEGPDANWKEKIDGLTVTPETAAEALYDRAATIAALDAASSNGTITLALGEDYTVTLSFKVTTPYVDPDPTPSGGGSTTTTPATTYEDEIVAPENGTVEIGTEDAKAGDEVTITATPAEGYQIARYIVTDEQGNKVEVDAKDGTFIQPEGNVKVEVVFAPIGGEIEFTDVQPSPQALTVDGVQQNVHAYNIDGENFVQLRDLAAMLAGTDAQFNVTYDAEKKMAVMTTGEAYSGTVSSDFSDLSSTAVPSPQSFMIDGRIVELSAVNIGGYNYFKLRDLAPFFGFGVDYDVDENTAQLMSK